jgi:hypothetical protein
MPSNLAAGTISIVTATALLMAQKLQFVKYLKALPRRMVSPHVVHAGKSVGMNRWIALVVICTQKCHKQS